MYLFLFIISTYNLFKSPSKKTAISTNFSEERMRELVLDHISEYKLNPDQSEVRILVERLSKNLRFY
jgi:hypothetical protein